MLSFTLYLQLEDSLLPACSYFLSWYKCWYGCEVIYRCLRGPHIYVRVCCSAIHGFINIKKPIKNPLFVHLSARLVATCQGRSSPKAFPGQGDTLSPRSILGFFLDGHTWGVCEASWWDTSTITNGSSSRALLWAQLLLAIVTSLRLIPVTLGRELISASCISDLYPN